MTKSAEDAPKQAAAKREPAKLKPTHLEPAKPEPGQPEPAKPEPWLRGTHREIPAVARAVVHAMELAQEDIERWTAGMTDEQLHRRPGGLPSIAWQMRHLARSVDRLLSYAEARQLTAEQMHALRSEDAPGTAAELRDELMAAFEHGVRRVTALAKIDPETHRSVGRRALPTTVGGLLVHVADHTQRHTGQLVTTAKLVRATDGC